MARRTRGAAANTEVVQEVPLSEGEENVTSTDFETPIDATDDVDAPVEDNETDEAPAVVDDTKPAAAAKAKEKARGDLPEGYVTPVGLAHALTEHYKATNPSKLNSAGEFASQMVYSYVKNAPKDRPFPMETIKDSIGKDRQVVKLEAGLEWFKQKDAQVKERKDNAAAKAAAKAERAAAKPAEGAATEAAPADATPVEEAE